MLCAHKQNCLWDGVSSFGRGLAVAREGHGGGVERTVGKLMSAHTTARCWNGGQSPFGFHLGTMQKILTMDDKAYELILNYLPGTSSSPLK